MVSEMYSDVDLNCRFLLLLAVVPAASPRLPSQEARVSLGARLPLGEASELCALQLRQLSGRTAEGLCAPRAARAKLGRRERLGGGVRRTGGRGAPEPRSRAPWSAAEELLPPSNRFVDCARSASPAERSVGETLAEGPRCPSPARRCPGRSLRVASPAPFSTALGTAPGLVWAQRALGTQRPQGSARSHPRSPRRPRQSLHRSCGDPKSAAPGPGHSRGRKLPYRGLPFLPEPRRGHSGPGPSHRRGPGLGLQSPRPGGSNGGARQGLGKGPEPCSGLDGCWDHQVGVGFGPGRRSRAGGSRGPSWPLSCGEAGQCGFEGLPKTAGACWELRPLPALHGAEGTAPRGCRADAGIQMRGIQMRGRQMMRGIQMRAGAHPERGQRGSGSPDRPECGDSTVNLENNFEPTRLGWGTWVSAPSGCGYPRSPPGPLLQEASWREESPRRWGAGGLFVIFPQERSWAAGARVGVTGCSPVSDWPLHIKVWVSSPVSLPNRFKKEDSSTPEGNIEPKALGAPPEAQGATKDMGKMLGGEEEKDPDAQKKEEERQEALRQQEEERKAKHARMEAEREKVRQQIRDKVSIP
ncbi:hypothetical protein NN561_015811 [Cricetulus griseus]